VTDDYHAWQRANEAPTVYSESAPSTMSPVKAARILLDGAKTNDDLRIALAAICSRLGCKDIAEFAKDHPEQAIEMAEDYESMMAQTPPGFSKL
jgi:hypothetical protein